MSKKTIRGLFCKCNLGVAITTTLSLLANAYDVQTVFHGQVSLAVVNHSYVFHEGVMQCHTMRRPARVYSFCLYFLHNIRTYKQGNKNFVHQRNNYHTRNDRQAPRRKTEKAYMQPQNALTRISSDSNHKIWIRKCKMI